LVDDEKQAGQKSYLKVMDSQFYTTEDFKIEYVHAVTETQTIPNRATRNRGCARENNFWTLCWWQATWQVKQLVVYCSDQYYVHPFINQEYRFWLWRVW